MLVTRNCLFDDEMELKFHKKYSRASCLLECKIDYAAKMMGNDSCIPWYLPTVDGYGLSMCDPWNAVDYRKNVEKMTDECEHCL